MHISITAPARIRTQGFQDSATNRLMRSLSRFSRRIDRIDVAITDENGPRGGIDPFVGTATDASPWDAMNRAVTRAQRKVITNLKRRRSQRERLHRTRGGDSVFLDL